MNIESKNHAGVTCVLVRQRDGQPIPKGTLVALSNDTTMRLVGGRAPHKPGSTGKVWVAKRGDMTDATSEYYPSVINCEWVESASCPQRQQDGVAAA